MENQYYKNYDVSNFEEKLKGRIKPQIYAFKTNTVPSFVKIGDTYRTVDERLNEWNRIYNDVFEYEDEIDKQHNPFFVEDSVLNNNKDVYFRDLSVHKYLRTIGKHQFSNEDRKKYKINQNQYVSKEFYLNVKKEDIKNAIIDINENYENKSKYYDYYDINTKENKEVIYDNQIKLIPRQEQQAVIDRFINKYKKLSKIEFPKRYLIYAVMRFGKTFTSLCCAKEMNAKVVLVVSAKADVKNEWKKNVESVVNFKEYKFLDEKQLRYIKIKDILRGHYNKNKENDNEPDKNKVVIFLTLQDLKDVKKKFNELYKTKIDMLIVDETHFGAWASKLGEIIDNAHSLEIKELESEDKDNLNNVKKFDNTNSIDFDQSSLEKLEKQLNVKIILHLSGTPYNLLLRNKFNDEDILAEITYSDVLDYKKEWNDRFLKYEYVEDITNKKDLNEILRIKHFKSIDEYKKKTKNLLDKINSTSDEEREHYKNEYNIINKINEFENPYFGFPEMLRFAFNPTEEAYKKIEALKKQDGSISLSLIFRTNCLKKEKGYDEFIHKDIVLNILESLDGKKDDKFVFPILDFVKNKNRDIARHMVFVLPFCASCDALEKLIKNNNFNNLKDYKTINISGLNIDKKYETVENIKQTISECEKNNQKTITLTVERMLTGTTVPEWDTMVFFRDIQSAEHYDQAIYRLQNPYILLAESDDGNNIKIDNKPQTLLIDFSLSRMFLFTERRLFLQNINQGKKDDELEESIKNELQKSPIYILKSQKMVEVEPTDLMTVVAKYSGYRSIIDDASEIRFNINVLNNNELRNVIEEQEVYNNGKFGLNINKFNDKNRQSIITILKKHKGVKDNVNVNENDNSNKLDSYEILRKQWKVYWSRILFFAFLTKSKINTFNDMINILQNDSDNLDDNKRILKNLEIDIKNLKLFHKLLPAEEVLNISRQIYNKNKLSHEEYLDDNEIITEFDRRMKKVDVAIRSFSRLGASEIVTPLKVCQEMIDKDKISDAELNKIIDSKKYILDINSKVAEFTSAFVKRLLMQKRKDKFKIGDKRLYNLFYSIVSSSHAYEFTRYVYELLELNINNISSNFNSYDLVNIYRSKDEIEELEKQKKNIKNNLKFIRQYYKLLNNYSLDEKANDKKNKLEADLKDLIVTNKIDKNIVEIYEDGLNEELENIEVKISQRIDYDRIKRIINQNKRFSKIKLNDEVEESTKDMKFEIVVGNPPYQKADGGAQASAEPIYQNFVRISKKISNKYVIVIIPSRWYTGGKHLDDFRAEMLNDNHIVLLDDFLHPEEIFPDTNNRGGLCDFLWDSTKNNKNEITIITHNGNNEKVPQKAKLKNKRFDVFIRNSISSNILDKVIANDKIDVMETFISSRKPYGIESNIIKTNNWMSKNDNKKNTFKCLGKGETIGYVKLNPDLCNNELINIYKVFTARANNIGTELEDDNFNTIIGEPGMICTEAYIVLGVGLKLNSVSAKNLSTYMKTKFVRFMHSLAKTSHDAPKKTYCFVPLQDFTNKSDIDWKQSIENIDKQLYNKYELEPKERAFIEKSIKPIK